MHKMKNAGVHTQVHYIPVHKQPFHRNKFKHNSSNKIIEAEKYYNSCISIPLYSSMQDRDADYVIENILSILKKQ